MDLNVVMSIFRSDDSFQVKIGIYRKNSSEPQSLFTTESNAIYVAHCQHLLNRLKTGTYSKIIDKNLIPRGMVEFMIFMEWFERIEPLGVIGN